MTATTFSAKAARSYAELHDGMHPTEVAGLRFLLHARSNGALVGLYDGELAGMDTDGGRWSTVCESHSFIINHEDLSTARYQQSAVNEWCEACMYGEAYANGETTEPEPVVKAEPKAKAKRSKSSKLAKLSPAEIDEQLFPLWADRWVQAERLANNRRVIAKALWPEEFKETYEKYMDRFSSKATHFVDLRSSWELRYFEGYVERYREAEARLAEAQEAIRPLDEEYDRRPWMRYVLVGAGHLHYGGCHTLRPTTKRYLLSESSGLSADEVVARYSYVACTKCFPEAPV